MIAKIGAAHNASLVSSADIRVLPADSFGGADRVRTDDPLLAKQVLSQLSYSPGPKVRGQKAEGRSQTRRIVSAFCPLTSDLSWWA